MTASTIPTVIKLIFDKKGILVINIVACEVKSRIPESALIVKPIHASLPSEIKAVGSTP